MTTKSGKAIRRAGAAHDQAKHDSGSRDQQQRLPGERRNRVAVTEEGTDQRYEADERQQRIRPLHHGRPAGGPLAGAQPAQAGHRPLGGGLGQPVARRPLADARRLHRGLSRRLRGRDPASGPARTRLPCSASARAASSPPATPRSSRRGSRRWSTPSRRSTSTPTAGEERLGYGFINLWTRNLPPEEIDRLIDAHGTLPGDFMGAVFSMMTPMRSLAEVQPRPARGGRGREEAPELPAHGEVDRRPPGPPGRGRQAVAEGPLPAEQAGQERVRARRPEGRPRQHHHAGAQRLRPGRPHHPAGHLAGARRAGRHARTTPSWRCPAAMSASSSAASRRSCSAPGSPNGSLTRSSGTIERRWTREEQDRLPGRGDRRSSATATRSRLGLRRHRHAGRADRSPSSGAS